MISIIEVFYIYFPFIFIGIKFGFQVLFWKYTFSHKCNGSSWIGSSGGRNGQNNEVRWSLIGQRILCPLLIGRAALALRVKEHITRFILSLTCSFNQARTFSMPETMHSNRNKRMNQAYITA